MTSPYASLIAAVESGADFIPSRAFDGTPFASGQAASDFAAAYLGSLDAVARLEAPLRERGWLSDVFGPDRGGVEWQARLMGEDDDGMGRSDTEARARLLAVLDALSQEKDA